ncbi:MAG TPA: TonB-dependent receptor [Acidobacteriota bacterium]|nr:TonB-dependent receptor [Acidobacteriota bacterium]
MRTGVDMRTEVNRMMGAMLLISLLVFPAWTQSTASRVDGVVTDASGGVIQSAAVTIINRDAEFTEKTTTNNSGIFVFPRVSPGTYLVTVEKAGFKTGIVQDVTVHVGVPRTVDIMLEIGGIEERVEVVASPANSLINAVNAENQTVVDRRQITSLPLPGRDPLEFSLMQAGVTGRQENRNPSVHGTRGSYQNLTLDGMNNQDNFIRTDAFSSMIPVRESFVEEFTITTSNAGVDAGTGAGHTNMITRSGAVNYHGSVYYFHRNSALNANEFFNNATGIPRDHMRNHQYGFNAGGPALSNELLFFINWEEERDRSSVSVVRTVLTEQARNGLFTYRRGDNGGLETVDLPALTGVAADTEIERLIDMTPLPNDSSTGDGLNTEGFRFNSPGNNARKWFSLRLDYRPESRHSLSAVLHRFSYRMNNDPFNRIDAVFPGLPGAGQKSTRYLGSISLRSVPQPAMINEARFGVQYAPIDFYTTENFSSGYQLHFPMIDNPVRNFLSQRRNAPVYELVNNFSWIKGNHTLKLGGGFRWTSADIHDRIGTLPQYRLGFGFGNFNPLDISMFPGGFADAGAFSRAADHLALLGGYVSDAMQVFNIKDRASGFVPGHAKNRNYRQRFFNLHAGDTWRLHRRLSLSIGLGWEYHGVPDESRGLALLPKNRDADILNPDAVLDFAGYGTGRNFYNRDLNNFAPSVGVAWRPFDSSSTVIRAGYSISYVNDSNFTAAMNAVEANPGIRQTVYVPAITGTVSGTGLVQPDAPVFMVPRPIRENITVDPFSAIYAIDGNFRTPYVQQWSFGLQHELFRDTAVEIRYVGNRGVKLARAVDLNQMMLPDEFVEDFRRAGSNLLTSGDPYIGEALTVIPQFGFGGGLYFAYNYLLTGEAGGYVGDFLAPNRAFFFAGEGGEHYGAMLPVGYFYRNPNADAADVLGNFSYSSYNALQAEIRRRFSSGLGFQVNYTFGKVLTDFGGSQTNFSAYMDNARPELEKMRADFDITHTVNANFVYDLPFGRVGRFAAQNSFVDALIGGWQLSGIMRIRSGEVISIVSQRATVNRWGRSSKNTVDLNGISVAELKAMTGVYRDAQGRVLMFDPSLISSDGTGNSDYFTNPGPASAGSLGLTPVSGPWYFTTDLAVSRTFSLPYRDGPSLELSVSFSNVFNRTNFDIDGTEGGVSPELSLYNAQSINSPGFGLINTTFAPRRAQIGIRLSF